MAKAQASQPFMLQGILPFDRAKISVDIIAGITFAALAIPETMGYAKIAGMPVITGLYTILIPIAIFALFGSSRHLVVGADQQQPRSWRQPCRTWRPPRRPST